MHKTCARHSFLKFPDKSELIYNIILHDVFFSCSIKSQKMILKLKILTLKEPNTTAADDKFYNIFPNFQKK